MTIRKVRRRPRDDRGDGYYKILTLIGVLALSCAGALGVWNVQRMQGRVFTLLASISAKSDEASRLRAEIPHIQTYLNDTRYQVHSSYDRYSPRFAGLMDEVVKTTKRLERARLDLKGKSEAANLMYREVFALKNQQLIDTRLGIALGIAGAAMSLVGIVCWYWRVQRFLEIEAEARMATNLAEQMVARTRSGALLARAEQPPATEAAPEPAPLAPEYTPYEPFEQEEWNSKANLRIAS